MIKIIDEDFIDQKGILAHQLNNKRVTRLSNLMEKYPSHYIKYMESEPKLGMCVPSRGEDGNIIIAMISQNGYGNPELYTFTHYDAFRYTVQTVANFAKEYKIPVYMPYGIGSGRGGGDWETIYNILEEVFKDWHLFLCRSDNDVVN